MTRPLELSPFDLDDARQAIKVAGSLQQGIESDLRDRSRELAEAERAYRRELSEAIVHLHSEGTAWSVCSDVARGSQRVADLRMARDIAAGVLDATKQAAFRRGADRRDLSELVTWSMKRDLAEGNGPLRSVA